jgi:hypothetical protein
MSRRVQSNEVQAKAEKHDAIVRVQGVRRDEAVAFGMCSQSFEHLSSRQPIEFLPHPPSVWFGWKRPNEHLDRVEHPS